MNTSEFKDKINNILDNIEIVIIGKREKLEIILSSILSNGHILLEDLPGLGKTLISKSFAQSMDISFNRIQFTPDLLPSDITGTYIYNPSEQNFNFSKGPVFNNIILADEINRANPKSQSALLECMEEKQITIEGKTFPLDNPFIVIATQNPIEYEGTYPLPEAQLDRFMIKLDIGYPKSKEEIEIINIRENRKKDEMKLNPIIKKDDILKMYKFVEQIYVSKEIKEYIVEIIDKTRNNKNIQVGASPRGSLSLYKMSKAYAAIKGRNFVTPEDVKYLSGYVLVHRIILTTDLWVRNINTLDVINKILSEIPVPDVDDIKKEIDV